MAAIIPQMHDVTDMELLRDYARQGSEAAFAELVRRHINLVYSAALRHAGIAAQAEEIAQAVFIILARKAGHLREGVILEAWLYQTTRLTALSFLRGERRRQFREQEAYMQSTLSESTSDPTWQEFSPLLDEAIMRLGRHEREVVVLRFFKDRSLGEVAAALNIKEPAAQMRVGRALEKLRKYFLRRGVASTTAIISGSVSANSVHAAPAGLAETISAAALAKGAVASASTLTLVKGALKLMAWAHAKTAIIVGAGILLAAGTTTVVVAQIHNYSPHVISDKIPDNDTSIYWNMSKLFALPPNILALRQSHFPEARGAIVATRGGDFHRHECRMAGAGQSLSYVLAMAYEVSPVRMVLPQDAPQGLFDFLITLPAPSQQEQVKRLQKEITQQLGLAGQMETIETNVLLLRVANANAQGLKPTSSWSSSEDDRGGKRYLKDWDVGTIAARTEFVLNEPVFDDTGMKGRYDFVLDQKFFNGKASREEINKMLMDQFGMELVPATRPVDMLVVEKTQ